MSLCHPSPTSNYGACLGIASPIIHKWVSESFCTWKVSACGHELGSRLLFGRRIGFSGTPSQILPVDLGTCQYEPGSDGKILDVLGSERVVVAVTRPSKWTAQSLLREIASSERNPTALIDTGALITGMDNEEVAHFLLKHLPPKMEGVVFLDRQVILSSPSPISTCSSSWHAVFL